MGEARNITCAPALQSSRKLLVAYVETGTIASYSMPKVLQGPLKGKESG